MPQADEKLGSIITDIGTAMFHSLAQSIRSALIHDIFLSSVNSKKASHFLFLNLYKK